MTAEKSDRPPAQVTGSTVDRARFTRSSLGILSAAAAYVVVSTAARLFVSVWPGISIGGLAQLSTNSIHDFLLIFISAGVVSLLAYWTRGQPVLPRVLHIAFVAFGFLLVLLSCINAQALSLIGGPLTFQWLYHADFLGDFTAQTAVSGALNADFATLLGGAILGYFILYFSFRWLLGLAEARGVLPLLLKVAAGLGILFVAFAFYRRDTSTGERDSVNRLVEIISTAVQGGISDLLDDPDAIPPPKLPPPDNARELLPAPLADERTRNVVLIVLESVGANHVPGTGPAHTASWMPALARYRSRSLAFQNVYTHAAYSTKSMFSLVTGRVPRFTFNAETYAYSRTPLMTLSGRLKELDYRTAFFMSGEFAFQSVDAFLAGRGFDQLSDMKTLGCSNGVYRGSTVNWPNLDSIDDEGTARAVVDWIGEPSGKPFFAVFWTGNTHWPYFAQAEPRPSQYSQDPVHNRYLAALRGTDLAVGYILDELTRQKMLDDTVVIVVGDHGQAFKEHGFSTHGNTLFEEEMRIPLLIVRDGIQGGSSQVLGGLSDVAPTILHLIGEPAEPSWDGRSLFDRSRPKRVWLFATNEEMAVGFREGSRKYGLRLARGKADVFDLATDPGERRSIADEYSASYIRRHVAGWAQEQKRRYDQLNAASAKTPDARPAR